jgi:RimJ/RimL family protein N-acetyltransferase
LGGDASGRSSAPVRIDAEPVDVDTHLDLIHSWMNKPHVAEWWELDRPRADVGDYLSALTHLQPWVTYADGVPFGYVETYRVADDPLAGHYPARAADVGWHLLVGPEEFLGSGIPQLLGRAFVSYLLDAEHPHRGSRVVCEPDIRNTRMHAFCRRLGFHSVGHVDLPDKRAVLMVHPGDDATLRHIGARHDDAPRPGERP